jgi:hypothetical protein
MTQVTAFLSRERPLQDPMESGEMARFLDKSCGVGGPDSFDGRAIDIGAHVDHRDRRGGLDVPRDVNAIHGPVQLDVHEHDIRVMGEGLLNRLRATVRQGHDLIPEPAEPAGPNLTP